MLERNTWILVADGSRARLFRNESPKVVLRPALNHEMIGENRPSRELVSDKEGRNAGPGVDRRQAMDQETDPKEHEKQRFLKETAEVLEHELQRHAYDSLVLIAPPKALGELRDNLSKNVTDCIIYEYNKDLTKDRTDKLEERLRGIFRPI